jgi:hypothetical protein
MTARRQYQPVQRHGPNPAMLVLIIGMIALSVLKLMSGPLMLLVGAAAFLVHQAQRGRLLQSLPMVVMAGVGLSFIGTPRMYPLMIGVFVVMILIGRNRRIW